MLLNQKPAAQSHRARENFKKLCNQLQKAAKAIGKVDCIKVKLRKVEKLFIVIR